jgi:hypothetical protein
MLHVGITGHTNLTEAATRLVYRNLVTVLRRTVGGLRGVTCLAEGADQIFAEAILAARGSYEVIVPARDYRARAIRPENTRRFDSLLRRASEVIHLPLAESNEAAFASANAAMIARSDQIVAVWDGCPSGRVGGTAHTVTMAERAGVPVTRVWPAGARRVARRHAERATFRHENAGQVAVSFATSC